MVSVVAALCAGLAAALVIVVRPVPRPLSLAPEPALGGTRGGAEATQARRWVVSGLAGVGAWLLVGGPVGVALGAVAAGCAWRVLARAEPRAARLAREEALRELPHLVGLLSGPLAAGLSAEAGLEIVCRALPGAAADRFAPTLARARVGADPITLWRGLADDPALAPLARTLVRSHETGAGVEDAITTLAESLASGARAEVEDLARRVGVQAAVPLGLCLLPAFLLLGIVPVVAGLITSVLTS